MIREAGTIHRSSNLPPSGKFDRSTEQWRAVPDSAAAFGGSCAVALFVSSLSDLVDIRVPTPSAVDGRRAAAFPRISSAQFDKHPTPRRAAAYSPDGLARHRRLARPETVARIVKWTDCKWFGSSDDLFCPAESPAKRTGPLPPLPHRRQHSMGTSNTRNEFENFPSLLFSLLIV